MALEAKPLCSGAWVINRVLKIYKLYIYIYIYIILYIYIYVYIIGTMGLGFYFTVHYY